MRLTLWILTLFIFCSCGRPGGGLDASIVHGTGSVVEENTESFQGFVIRSEDGKVFSLESGADEFKKPGLIVEFVGVVAESRIAAAPKSVQFLKLAVVGSSIR